MKAEQFRLNSQLELSHWWFVGRRRILQRLITQLLPPSKEHLLVDVGCGTGGNIAAFSRQYECVGMDTSPEAVGLARQRFRDVQFLCGEAPDRLGELARRARLFMLTDVLEHVQDDFFLLSRLMEAASPGALFVITVPADLSLWSQHDEIHRHYRRYDQQRLQAIWEGLPVRSLLVSHFNSRLYPLIKTVRTFTRRRGTTAGEAGTDLRLPRPWLNQTLTRTFAGESGRLLALLDRRRRRGYRRGVSLLAVLRRERGSVTARRKPAAWARDFYQPPQGDQADTSIPSMHFAGEAPCGSPNP